MRILCVCVPVVDHGALPWRTQPRSRELGTLAQPR
jgi:hypothetical protein